MTNLDGPDQVALLIDIANCRNVNFTQLLELARRRGELVITRAYGNFANCRDLSQLLGEFDEKQYRDRKNRPFKKFIEFLKEAEARGHIHLVRQGSGFLVTTAAEQARVA